MSLTDNAIVHKLIPCILHSYEVPVVLTTLSLL